MVGGYKTKGSSVRIPPNSLTYSDTGMFMDPDTSTNSSVSYLGEQANNALRSMVSDDIGGPQYRPN